jgi:hypothetical protein
VIEKNKAFHISFYFEKAMMFVSVYLILYVFICLIGNENGSPIISNNLHTWWHNNIEYNDHSPVNDNYVRSSTTYSVQVKTVDSNDTQLYDSFTYMSIPRGGRDKWEYNSSDGAEFAQSCKLTMSWSTFLYLKDVWIIIRLHKLIDMIHSIDDVIIRPTTLNFKKELIDPLTIRILIPYNIDGYRFV